MLNKVTNSRFWNPKKIKLFTMLVFINHYLSLSLFWHLSVAVERSMRMRFSTCFGTAMASSVGIVFGISRLHMRGLGSLLKCVQKFDTCFQRSIGTNVAARVQLPRKDETGKCV